MKHLPAIKRFSRRAVLSNSFNLSLILIFANEMSNSAAGAAESTCAHEEQMDEEQKTLRHSQHYVELSPVPAQACIACSFFQPQDAGCGNCLIFSGPANPKGHCDSWNAKN
jgi:hypothetical protein